VFPPPQISIAVDSCLQNYKEMSKPPKLSPKELGISENKAKSNQIK
jgi:hypothetical protein